MSTEADKIRDTFADQLASFDDKLASKVDDVQMLSEIRAGIGRLLEASGGNEGPSGLCGGASFLCGGV